jgi:hypothetical protein
MTIISTNRVTLQDSSTCNHKVKNCGENAMSDRDDFSYFHSVDHEQITLTNWLPNTRLQQLVQEIDYLCNLEKAGKISARDAYYQIKELSKQLNLSTTQPSIGISLFHDGDIGQDLQ